MSTRADVSDVEREFAAFVGAPAFPCLAGKGVVRAGNATIGVYGRMGSQRSSRALAHDLRKFVRNGNDDDRGHHAMVAIFTGSQPSDEQAFEHLLWRQLQRLHELEASGTVWDPRVTDDPDDPHFAFSFAGSALFVVGLHSESSRLARRFRWPTLVFNPHSQFEQLRADGHFDRLRSMVRDREVVLQGSINPSLGDFGEQSEARQYSGRHVEADWKCPFHRT